MNFKRLLFFLHRWLGVAAALFMLMWFVSGLVIVYSSYMIQDRSAQLAHATPLKIESGWLGLGQAWEEYEKIPANTTSATANKAAVSIVDARLIRQNGHPVWLIEDTQGKRHAISAQDGRPWQATPEAALGIVAEWLAQEGQSGVSLSHVETLDKPGILRGQDSLAPFHRVALEKSLLGTEFLVSAKTGEIVHVSNLLERGAYWTGNWIHLFRFLEPLGLEHWRTDALLWAIVLSFIACVTGLVVGWLRWRPGWFGKPTYSEGRVHPYRAFWLRWHFWAGLIGGIAATLWALSGVFNTLQDNLFSRAAPSREALQSYYGNGIPDTLKNWRPATAIATIAALPEAENVVQLSWHRLGDQAVLLAHTRNGTRTRLDSGLSESTLTDAAFRLAQTGPEVAFRAESLLDYDAYYYPRHRRGDYGYPLPVWRVQLEDEAGTQVYLDPLDGRILLKNDSSRRAYRWLWSALHHWDIPVLYKRPLWDAWMLLWLVPGLVLGVSSVVLGVNRLNQQFRPKKGRKAAQPGLDDLVPTPEGG
jgi:hypothetical protein